MVFLTGLLPASCHKTPPQQKAAPPAVVAAGIERGEFRLRNLGEISLTNHNETCLRLATSESCTLTPDCSIKTTVLITLALESKNDYGETSRTRCHPGHCASRETA